MKNKSVVILLVEDDPDHTTLVKEALTVNEPGLHIEVVTDGEIALDYLQRRGPFFDAEKYPTPHLVLLDIKLPKVDGIEVLKQIKADKALKAIPVVMLTTSTNPEEINKCYGSGADGYITKPFDFIEFRSKLNTLKDYLVEAALATSH